ncbi:MAG: hypothetical protein EBS98_02315 [Chitinophagia bacterium]|nr:hypothetical protein [Chitinophagia bacterium]
MVHNRTNKVGKVSKNQPKEKVYPTFTRGTLISQNPLKPEKRPTKTVQNTSNYPYLPLDRHGIGYFRLFLFS